MTEAEKGRLEALLDIYNAQKSSNSGSGSQDTNRDPRLESPPSPNNNPNNSKDNQNKDSQSSQQSQNDGENQNNNSKLVKKTITTSDGSQITFDDREEDSPLNPDEEKQEQERIAKIKDYLDKNKTSTLNDMIRDKDKVNKAEAERVRAKEYEKQKQLDAVSLNGFENQLYNAIADQVKAYRGVTSNRLNTKYYPMGIYMPGRGRIKQERIPTLWVYYDYSGSFSSHPEKIRMTDRVLESLQKFEDQNMLVKHVKYVSTKVTDTKEGSTGGGAYLDPIIRDLMSEADENAINNVLIVSDSDIDNSGSLTLQVNGVVWWLYMDAPGHHESSAHITGKEGTYTYNIDVSYERSRGR